MTTTNDPDLELLRRYRNARPAPIVDVTQRVCDTIREIPRPSLGVNSLAMAASAAVCAATAATLACTAFLQPTDRWNSSSTVVDFVIDTHEVDVQSILR